jgi:hypothetical protein
MSFRIRQREAHNEVEYQNKKKEEAKPMVRKINMMDDLNKEDFVKLLSNNPKAACELSAENAKKTIAPIVFTGKVDKKSNSAITISQSTLHELPMSVEFEHNIATMYNNLKFPYEEKISGTNANILNWETQKIHKRNLTNYILQNSLLSILAGINNSKAAKMGYLDTIPVREYISTAFAATDTFEELNRIIDCLCNGHDYSRLIDGKISEDVIATIEAHLGNNCINYINFIACSAAENAITQYTLGGHGFNTDLLIEKLNKDPEFYNGIKSDNDVLGGENTLFAACMYLNYSIREEIQKSMVLVVNRMIRNIISTNFASLFYVFQNISNDIYARNEEKYKNNKKFIEENEPEEVAF